MKKELFCEQKILSTEYSTRPSAQMNAERLIKGLPAFKHFSMDEQKKPKKLIVTHHLRDKSLLDKLRFVYQLSALHQEGFEIFFDIGQELKPYQPSSSFFDEIKSLNSLIFLDPTKNERFYADKLDCSGDEIYLFDALKIDEFIQDGREDWQAYNHLNEGALNLCLCSLNIQGFQRLMLENKDKIKKLCLSDCLFLIDPKQSESIFVAEDIFSQLEEFEISFDALSQTLNRYKNLLIKLQFYNLILDIIQRSPSLKKITIRNVNQLIKIEDVKILLDILLKKTHIKGIDFSYDGDQYELTNLPEYRFEQMEDFNIDIFSIDTEILRRLCSSQNLKTLQIDLAESIDSTIILPQSIEEFEWRSYIDFEPAQLDFESAQQLLSRAKTLKKLSLHSLACPPEKTFNIELPLLEELKLTYSSISSQGFHALLANAPKLKKLILRGCGNITEHLDVRMELPALEELDLNDSSISSQGFHALLANAPKLKTLNLMGCKNIREHLEEGMELPALEELDFNHSSISLHGLRALLANAPNLKTLNLRGCGNITEHLEEGMELPALEELNLQSSSISSQGLRALLANASKLKTLDLRRCKNIHEEFYGEIELPALEELFLNDSSISSQGLHVLLANAPMLKTLDLRRCKNIHEEFYGEIELPALEELFLNDSSISSQGLHVLLANAPMLKKLDLRECKIITEHFDVGMVLPALEELDLNDSSVSSQGLHALLVNAPKLKRLDLSGCENITGHLEVGMELPALEKFFLNYSSISSQGLHVLLANAPKLKTLDLRSCKNIHENLNGEVELPELQELFLKDSSISSQGLHALLANAPKLKTLDLSVCKNITEQLEVRMVLPALEELHLQSSSISSQGLRALLANAPKLKTLNLMGCKNIREHLEEGMELPALEELDFNHSSISSQGLRALLANAPKLKTLILRGCGNITEHLEEGMELPALEELDLNYSSISSQGLRALLANAPKLKTLNLRGCENITEHLEEGMQLPALEELILNYSSISSQGLIDLLIHAPQLNRLGLENCQSIPQKFRKTYDGQESIRQMMDELKAHDRVDEKLKADTLSEHEENHTATASTDSVSVDADTALKNQTFSVKKEFKEKRNGQLRDIKPAEVRHDSYDKLEWIEGRNPFLLCSEKKDNSQVKVIEVKRSPYSLLPDFTKARGDCYLGRFELDLTKDWQPIPSVMPHEKLKSFFVNSNALVQMGYSKYKNMYYIRIAEDENQSRSQVFLEVLLDVKIRPDTKSLPKKVKDLIASCRSYSSNELVIRPNMSGEDYIKAIIQQKTGACRHRAVAFKYQMQNISPQIPVRIITNDCHAYVEILYQSEWIKVDLGGYPSNLQFQKDLFEEDLILKAEQESNERETQANETLDLLQNLIIDGLPLPEGDFSQVKELVIKNLEIDALELNAFFSKLPDVKTLQLLDCSISNLRDLEITRFQKIETNIPKEQWPVLDAWEIVEEPKKVKTSHFLSKSEETLDMLAMLSAPEKRILMETGDVATTRLDLQTLCRSTSRSFYYVDHPDELRCLGPFIRRKKDMKGQIIDKPGGALYDYLTNTNPIYKVKRPKKKMNRKKGWQSRQKIKKINIPIPRKSPPTTLILNLSRFRTSDFVQYNSLFDDEPRIEGLDILKGCKIIGLTDINIAQDASITSRFELKSKMHLERVLPKPSVSEEAQGFVIECCGGLNWESRLVGGWVLDGQRLTFKKGLIWEAMERGESNLVFNNAPLEDPNFIRLMHDMTFYQGLFHQGEMLVSVPSPISLSYVNYRFIPEQEGYLDFIDTREEKHVLNPDSLEEFIGKYDYQAKSHSIRLKKGLIEESAGKSLSVYLTASLTFSQWQLLMDNCRTHQTKLNVVLAPSVVLPEEIKVEGELPRLQLREVQHSLCVNQMPIDLKDAIYIDISELTPDDLLPSLKRIETANPQEFKFQQIEGFLNIKLAAGETIVLSGDWVSAKNLTHALHDELLKRMENANAKGQLILVQGTQNAFPFMTETLVEGPQLEPIKISEKASFQERDKKVSDLLQQHRMVILTGPTGVGKTYFVNEHYRHAHFGEKHILDWVLDNKSLQPVLFIDEANMSYQQWSMFEGLFQEPPGIFYQGQYYPLTEHHRLIFAGNPLSYGGERQLPSLFRHHPVEVEFSPLTADELLTQLQISEELGAVIKPLLDFIFAIESQKVLLTPREILMAVQVGEAWGHVDDVAYSIFKTHVPKERQKEFEQFKPKNPKHAKPKGLKSFVVNATNQEAIDVLTQHLLVRHRRVGGLGGVVLEGEPGVGKSQLVTQLLTEEYDLKEGRDFIRIPVSLAYEKKQKMLLEAFHQGKIAIIDEINASPMMERLLNALLEGHDLENKPAKKASFMMIGTQNPPTNRGRVKTTLPLKHRLQTVDLKEYTDKEMQAILEHTGVTSEESRDLIADYQRHRQSMNLCFRDLLREARHFKSKTVHLENYLQRYSLYRKKNEVTEQIKHDAQPTSEAMLPEQNIPVGSTNKEVPSEHSKVEHDSKPISEAMLPEQNIPVGSTNEEVPSEHSKEEYSYFCKCLWNLLMLVLIVPLILKYFYQKDLFFDLELFPASNYSNSH